MLVALTQHSAKATATWRITVTNTLHQLIKIRAKWTYHRHSSDWYN